MRVGVSNSFGFGGHNACTVVRRFERIAQLDGAWRNTVLLELRL